MSNALIKLGTEYGGWHLPKTMLIDGIEIAVCVGAGEDISYDLILSAFCKRVFVFDPTPKAVIHVGCTLMNLLSGNAMHSSPDGVLYNRVPHCTSSIIFYPLGLHGSDTVIEFYPPPQSSYASYSTENIQNTVNPIILPVIGPDSLMRLISSETPDILELDIEGAEEPFLKALVTSRLRPKILQVEFDMLLTGDQQGTGQLIKSILDIGYTIIHRDGRNMVFFLEDE